MENLYSKLYNKYNELKKKHESDIEQFSQDQEAKFLKYVSVAEETIEHLTSENAKLKAQIKELTEQVLSFRSAKETLYSEYQNLLAEEAQKSKELAEEVERLQKMQREGLWCSSRERNTESIHMDSPGGTQVRSQDRSEGSLCKKSYPQHVSSQRNDVSQMQLSLVTESERDTCRGVLSNGNENLPKDTICMGNSTILGENAHCLFQILVECLVGMKFVSVYDTEDFSLSVCHQSSGYSFSLKWVNKVADERAELLYHVLSLGTFERVAPEWMKEDLVFSTGMCHMFFKRVSRVIGLDY